LSLLSDLLLGHGEHAIATEGSFGIFSQFISLSSGKTGMDTVLAGDLSNGWHVGLKLDYY
jgi:hypothetical protein